MKNKYFENILQIIPANNTWSVWYDFEVDDISTSPIDVIALVELDGDRFITYYEANKHGNFVDPAESCNWLGISKTVRVSRSDWEEEINIVIEKNSSKEKTA